MSEGLPVQEPEPPDLIPEEAWRLLISEPSVDDYQRAAALIAAAEVARIADDLTQRASRRHAVAGDDGPECDGGCESSDCHTVSAVATYSMTAARLRGRMTELLRGKGGRDRG